MSFTDPILAGVELVRTAIRSAGYVAGTSGWEIRQDGTAEFADLSVLGGVLTGTITAGALAGSRVVIDGANGRVLVYDGSSILRLTIDSASTDVVTLGGISGSSLVLSTSAGAVGAGMSLTPAAPVGHAVTAAEVWTRLLLGRPSMVIQGPQLDSEAVPTVTLYSGTPADGSLIEITAGRTLIIGDASVTGDLDVQGGTWSAFSPTWTGATNPSYGNAVVTCRYRTLPGRTVVAQYDIVMGSTTTYGTGTYSLGLPVTARATAPAHVGSGLCIHGSTRVPMACEINTTSALVAVSTTGALLSATSPFTWASGDALRLEITYEAA